jgi:hypothetical protein
VGRSLKTVNARAVVGRRVRLNALRSARSAVVWRDAVAVAGTPQRLGETMALSAGGTLVCLLNADHPAAVAGGVLATYAGASRMLEPLRAEIDKPGRARVLLRARMGDILAKHAILPALVVLIAAAVATLGCAVAGALPRHGAVALTVVAATPAVTLCAALSSRRGGELPTSLMSATYADSSGMSGALILAWIVAWPVLALVLGTLPLRIVASHGVADLPQLVVLLVAAAGALAAALRWEQFAP